MSSAEVTVQGKAYSIACAPGHEDRLLELGQKLDQRVRHISRAVGDIGETRLLLVTALALLDEMDRLKPDPDAEASEAALALLSAAEHIERITARLSQAEGGI